MPGRDSTGHFYGYGIYGKGCYYCYRIHNKLMKQCTLGFAGKVYVSVNFDIFVRVFYSSSGAHAQRGIPASIH